MRGVRGRALRDLLVQAVNPAEVVEFISSSNCAVVTGFRGNEAYPGAGQDVQSEVSTAFGPLVVLLGKDGSDEPDQRIAVREDTDDIGPAADFLVESFLRIVGPDLTPNLFRECGECEWQVPDSRTTAL